ncbi:MAG: hypothetical protein R2710_21780, partial [Acidimicrobiales bacterium]
MSAVGMDRWTRGGDYFTEKEYDYAVETGTPVLAFLHADPDGLPKRDTEADGEGSARLDQFREKVSLRMCKYWSTPAELGSVVSRSLIKTMKNSPAKGWVRADQAMTSDQIVEMEQLRRQVAEFEKERFEEGSHVPDGIDEFAQGADETELTYGFKATGSGFIADEYVSADEFTWDGIFSYLGPAMFDEASETSLRSLVNKMLEEQTIERNQKEIDGGNSTAELWGFLIDNASFDKVKVQLVALGLMSKSVKRHGVNDKNTYWSLTPYG